MAFYGATAGEAYINGKAGERFACATAALRPSLRRWEITAGSTTAAAVVLGPTGRNFAAGMSGGVAYVLDRQGDLASHCNTEMVDLGPLEGEEDVAELKDMIGGHVRYTKSALGQEVLDNWSAFEGQFVKVMPRDYRKMLDAFKRVEGRGLTGDEAALVAFREAMAEEA